MSDGLFKYGVAVFTYDIIGIFFSLIVLGFVLYYLIANDSETTTVNISGKVIILMSILSLYISSIYVSLQLRWMFVSFENQAWLEVIWMTWWIIFNVGFFITSLKAIQENERVMGANSCTSSDK